MVDDRKRSGIYQIRNILNNKVYVGSAIYLKGRKSTHYSNLKNNKHINKHLQRAFNKYGKENFVFEVIEYIDDKELLIEREQYWLDTKKPFDSNFGYNISPTAKNITGVKMSEETKLKMSKWQIGRKMSEESKIKMSISKKGKYLGENCHSAKLSSADVINIKVMLSQNMNIRNISEMFKVDKSVIYNIKYGKIWSHIELDEVSNEEIKKIKYSQKGESSTGAKLTDEKVIQIKKLLLNGLKNVTIAKMFDVDSRTISSIKTGKSWTHISIDGGI